MTKNLIILNRVLPPTIGSTGRLVMETADYFRARGWNINVIHCKAHGMPPLLLYAWAFFVMGIQAMFARRADHVLVMTDPPMMMLWIPLLKWRHRHVHYWCQDVYPDLFPVIGLSLPETAQRALMTMKRAALRCADNVIAIGACMKNILSVYANRVIVIRNWHDRTAGAPTDITADTPPIFLYAGNVGLVHPTNDIIAAVQACADLPVIFQFIIWGKGADKIKAALADQINVTFVPPQSTTDALATQSRAAVHIVALRDAALGLSVPVKAMAASAAARPILFLGPSESETAAAIALHGHGKIAQNAASFRTAVIALSDQVEWEKAAAAAQKYHQSLPDPLAQLAAVMQGDYE